MLSQSKAITSPNVTSIFGLLLNQLNTSIVALGNPSQGLMRRTISIEQSMALKGAYTVMKKKLLKYEPQVKRKPIFPIATMLDPSLKFEYIPTDEYMSHTCRNIQIYLNIFAFASIDACPTNIKCLLTK